MSAPSSLFAASYLPLVLWLRSSELKLSTTMQPCRVTEVLLVMALQKLVWAETVNVASITDKQLPHRNTANRPAEMAGRIFTRKSFRSHTKLAVQNSYKLALSLGS